jgi:hypothetical protein
VRAIDEARIENMQGNEASFYESAALACAALRQSDIDLWRRATEGWFGGGRDFAGSGCTIAAVRETMQSIMGSSPAPDSLPNITLGGSAPGYACRPTDFTLTPRSGTPETVVTLSWSSAPWMHYSGELWFGTEAFGLSSNRSESVSQLAPEQPPGTAPTVPVVLKYDDGSQIDLGTFTYE